MECAVPDPRTFFEEQLPQRHGAAIDGVLPGDVVVIFHIQGPGGGSWQVDTRTGVFRSGPIKEGPRDCEIWCSVEDFMGILRGNVNARRAFLTGRLRVLGDVGLALRLQGAFVGADQSA